MSKLLLYFKDEFYHEMEIQMPSFKNLGLFERVRAKEEYLKRKVVEFKLEHINEIIKMENNYKIYLQV